MNFSFVFPFRNDQTDYYKNDIDNFLIWKLFCEISCNFSKMGICSSLAPFQKKFSLTSCNFTCTLFSVTQLNKVFTRLSKVSIKSLKFSIGSSMLTACAAGYKMQVLQRTLVFLTHLSPRLDLCLGRLVVRTIQLNKFVPETIPLQFMQCDSLLSCSKMSLPS